MNRSLLLLISAVSVIWSARFFDLLQILICRLHSLQRFVNRVLQDSGSFGWNTWNDLSSFVSRQNFLTGIMSPDFQGKGRNLFGHFSHVNPAIVGSRSLLVNGDTSVDSTSLESETPGIVSAAAAHGAGFSLIVTFSTEILSISVSRVYPAYQRRT